MHCSTVAIPWKTKSIGNTAPTGKGRVSPSLDPRQAAIEISPSSTLLNGGKDQNRHSSIDWQPIESVLIRAQRILDTEYVAVFGVRDSSGNFYSYHLQELAFSPETVEQGGGRVRPYIYEFLAESGQGLLTTRIAIAYIPDTDLAEQSMTYWLLPNTVKERETESPAKRAKAGVGVVATEQTCYYSIRFSSRAIIFALAYCESNDVVVTPSGGGGGRNDDRPQWNWPSDPDCQRNMWGERDCDGGGGGGRNSCPPPYRCNNEDQPSCDLRQILRPAGCEEPEEEQPGPEPCRGDPVPNPEIAPQTNSGIDGGRYGETRTDKNGNPKEHKGIDLKNKIGDSLFSMYTGTVVNTGDQKKGWGKWVLIRSKVNDKDYYFLYAHLDEIDVSSGNSISQGSTIGKAGESGNLKNAKANGLAVQHSHVEIREVVPGKSFNNSPVKNPEDFMATKFDSNGQQVAPENCN